MSSTVILANGDFPTRETPLCILRNAERIVACDGAAASLLEHGITPDHVIGDLDSLAPELRVRLQDRIRHVTEQDTNDLNKAFRFCMEHGWKDIVILGATGKREDHTLGNISLLADFSLKAPGIKMVTDNGTFIAVHSGEQIQCVPGQQVSIFAMDTSTQIFSTGLKYKLNGLTPSRWWQATLNEATGDSFTLSFQPNKTLLVFLANA